MDSFSEFRLGPDELAEPERQVYNVTPDYFEWDDQKSGGWWCLSSDDSAALSTIGQPAACVYMRVDWPVAALQLRFLLR